MSDDLTSYQVVAARRASYDTLLWQVPVLSLTAQAFLFTIALAADTEPLARVVAALLSIVATVLSMLLMGKHRMNEIHDAEWLAVFEREHGLPVVHSHDYFKTWHRTHAPPWLRLSLYRIWLCGLAVFGLAAVAVLVVTAAAPGVLSG